MEVGTADCGLVNFDFYVIVAADGLRNFFHPKSGLGVFFYKCKHDRLLCYIFFILDL